MAEDFGQPGEDFLALEKLRTDREDMTSAIPRKQKKPQSLPLLLVKAWSKSGAMY